METSQKQWKFKRRCRRLGALVLITAIVLSIGAGCSTTTRHKILTVIFTGVPPLEDQSTASPVDDQQANVDTTVRRGRAARMPTFWVHGPFGARQCERCHNLSQSTNFLDDQAASRRDPVTSGSIAFASRLAMPKQQLCASCHSSHSKSAADKRSLQVHSPVLDGNCTACHHPHQTQRRFMLLGSSNRELCTRCHDPVEDEVMAAHARDSDADCVTCHNAHVGTKRALLKENDDEIALLYGHAD